MNGASTVWCTSSPAAGAKPRPQHFGEIRHMWRWTSVGCCRSTAFMAS